MKMPLGMTGRGNEQSDIPPKNHKKEITMKVHPEIFCQHISSHLQYLSPYMFSILPQNISLNQDMLMFYFSVFFFFFPFFQSTELSFILQWGIIIKVIYNFCKVKKYFCNTLHFNKHSWHFQNFTKEHL